MCAHWECSLCQCQILVLAPAFQTLHKYAQSTSVRSCVPTGNVRGASAKYCISTSISNTTQIRPQHFRNFMCVHWECAWCQCQILILAPAYPTIHKQAHSTLERSCVSTGNVRGASANISISTTISNTTQIRPQYFSKVMSAHWKCAWCQCQILVLAPAYPTLHKYAKSTSETSCVSTGNVRGASAKYWYQHQHIQHYTNRPTALQ